MHRSVRLRHSLSRTHSIHINSKQIYDQCQWITETESDNKLFQQQQPTITTKYAAHDNNIKCESVTKCAHDRTHKHTHTHAPPAFRVYSYNKFAKHYISHSSRFVYYVTMQLQQWHAIINGQQQISYFIFTRYHHFWLHDYRHFHYGTERVCLAILTTRCHSVYSSLFNNKYLIQYFMLQHAAIQCGWTTLVLAHRISFFFSSTLSPFCFVSFHFVSYTRL